MKTTERMSTMSGTVTQINQQARQLTIEGLVMNKTFEIADDFPAPLSDIKVGEEVSVTYEQHETTAVAHSFVRLNQEQQHREAA